MGPREALRRRFAPPEYVMFEEFTLFAERRGPSRRLDAIAISPWAARGFAIHGFEIKENRADWLRELANPHKADEGQAYCDTWSLVAPRGVAEIGEMPDGWGWLELRGEKLFRMREAAELKAVPIDRPFLARCLAHLEESERHAKQDRDWREREKVQKELEAEHKRELEQAGKKNMEALNELNAKVRTFELESGLSISRWGEAARVAPLVKQALAGTLHIPRIDFMVDQAKQAYELLTQARDALNRIEAEKGITP